MPAPRDGARARRAKNIKRRRKALGLTQAQVGERTGVSRTQISRYEKNLDAPSNSTLDHLLAALECSYEDLNRKDE